LWMIHLSIAAAVLAGWYAWFSFPTILNGLSAWQIGCMRETCILSRLFSVCRAMQGQDRPASGVEDT
jgi:hypothetical protein